MIGRFLFGVCALTLVSTTSLMAQPSGGTANDENKQICRLSADTGSRLARTRECHTAREWAELRRQTQQNVDHIQNARAANGGQ